MKLRSEPYEIELTSNNRIPAELRVPYFKLAIERGMTLMPWDIETSHMLVRTFYIGQKVSINHKQILAPTKIISIQYMNAKNKTAKYLEWDQVNTTEAGSNKFCDKSMVEEFITNILPKADIVLTQNGDAFDTKIVNERAKVHGLPPMPSIPSIDILKLSRTSVRTASHALDYRSSQQGLGGKIRMCDQDWTDIEENGVPVSKIMGPYGCKDAVDTLQVFFEELPYYKTLPVAIEKIVLDYLVGPGNRNPLERKKILCPECKKNKQKATDITALKTRNHFKCNRCNNHFRT